MLAMSGVECQTILKRMKFSRGAKIVLFCSLEEESGCTMLDVKLCVDDCSKQRIEGRERL